MWWSDVSVCTYVYHNYMGNFTICQFLDCRNVNGTKLCLYLISLKQHNNALHASVKWIWERACIVLPIFLKQTLFCRDFAVRKYQLSHNANYVADMRDREWFGERWIYEWKIQSPGGKESMMPPIDKSTTMLRWILLALLAALLMAALVKKLVSFSDELQYLNQEIRRTEGSERRYYQRERRRLWKSLLPFCRKWMREKKSGRGYINCVTRLQRYWPCR